jgi:hypothetical protein
LGRAWTFDVPILGFAMLYLVLQFGEAALEGFAMSTPVLHMVGAAVGAAAGVLLLRKGIVDCEGWDLFAVLAGREGEPDRAEEPQIRPNASLPAERTDEALAQARAYLAAENPTAVMALDQKLTGRMPGWGLPETELLAVVRQLHSQKNFHASIRPMVQYLKRFSTQSVPVRLKLAQILLVSEGRPYRALGVLEKIALDGLAPEQLRALEKLKREAERQLQDADLELDNEDW